MWRLAPWALARLIKTNLITEKVRVDFAIQKHLGMVYQVAGAGCRWRCQFRCRGSRRRSFCKYQFWHLYATCMVAKMKGFFRRLLGAWICARPDTGSKEDAPPQRAAKGEYARYEKGDVIGGRPKFSLCWAGADLASSIS